MSEPKYTGAEPLSNDKHERFVQNLMQMPVWDVGSAYERAGYKATGDSATASGNRLLQDVGVQKRIQTLQAERAERTQVTADRVIHELALVGFSNVNDYTVDNAGRIVLVEGAHPDAVRAVASVKRKVKRYTQNDEEVEEVEVDIKTWSKNSALDALAKHTGVTGPKGTEDDPHYTVTKTVTDEERQRRLDELRSADASADASAEASAEAKGGDGND